MEEILICLFFCSGVIRVTETEDDVWILLFEFPKQVSCLRSTSTPIADNADNKRA